MIREKKIIIIKIRIKINIKIIEKQIFKTKYI